jgi:ribosomal protein S18 acetylase RimI-like enzyme
MQNTAIREGRKEDLPAVLELIIELAVFERAGHEVINSVRQMELDGFGSHPYFGLFVAESGQKIVGISVYYYRYSTWKGKRLYLEDIVVNEKYRGLGIGKMLFEKTMEKCLEENCTGMMWQVLEWNDPAIQFYKRYGAKLDNEWTNGTLESSDIRQWLKNRTTPRPPGAY